MRAGLLRQVRVSTYGLGLLWIQLGATAVGALRVVNLGENYLQRLVEEGGETAVMSIWGGHGPVVVRVREPLSKLIQIRVAVGSALPIASAQGTIFPGRGIAMPPLCATCSTLPRPRSAPS